MEEKKQITPDFIGQAKVLFYIVIGESQIHTENTKSYVNGELMGAAYGLAICQYDKDDGYYLFDCDDRWETINDTFDDTIEDDKLQAEFECENTMSNWIMK